MRIVFVQAGLGAGGTEKVVSMLAHHRRELGDRVDVIAVNAASAASYFPYREDIRIHSLGSNSKRGLDGTVIRLRRLRARLQALQPQLVISFLTKINVMAGIATIGLDLPIIMSERNNFTAQEIHPAWHLLSCAVAGRAYGVVMQTQQAQASLPRHLKDRAVVIPNPVVPAPIQRRADGAGLKFVAVGRLRRQKGFDLLLKAFARAADKLPSATLAIFGEGSERAALERLADRLGVAGKLVMPGTTKIPYEWLDAGNIFVVSSRFEGFPNVLLEALAAGMPAVSFDCPWGPSEILRCEDGFPLVPAEDVDALAEALVHVASDPRIRRRLRKVGLRVAARFSESSVFAQWDELIGRTVAASAGKTAGQWLLRQEGLRWNSHR